MLSAMGTNAHVYANTTYATNWPGVVAGIQGLNMFLVRINDAGGAAKLKTAGMQTVGIAGSATAAKQMLTAGTDLLEGPNELYTNQNKGTQQARADLLKSTWDAVFTAREAYRSASGVRVPILGPSAALGDVADAAATAKLIGKLAHQPDLMSVHAYPGGRTPEEYAKLLQDALAIAGTLAPGVPCALTEFGTWWSDDPAVRAKATHHPTSPTDAVTLWPEYLDVITQAGFVWALTYEAVDEAGKALQEGHLGALNADLTDKLWTPTIRHLAATVGQSAQIATLQSELADRDQRIAVAQKALAGS